MTDDIDREKQLAEFEDQTERRKWKVRRRFAIISFAELVTLPFWAGPVIASLKTPPELVTALIWALVAIIGAYIGGVVVDNNWKR